MENKPNVFPSDKMSDAMKQANETGSKIAEQYAKEQNIVAQHKSQGELDAAAEMQRQTMAKLEEQLRKRDELKAQREAEAKGELVDPSFQEQPKVTYAQTETKSHKKIEISDDDKYAALSTPPQDVPYDLIKLPSEGLLYKNCKSAIKVSYLNAMDENIITNPNLLKSGKFLEILINRKIMDTNLRYKDLHVGDRNAIMIWLRSTGYGPMYKIRLSDPNNNFQEFETEIDLSKLPIKHLGEKPDEDGYFTYKLPVSQATVTFRLLSVGDIEEIEDHIEKMAEEVGAEFTDGSTYALLKQILAVEGNFDSDTVKNFVEQKMRIGDVRAFRKHVNEIESGVDMNITVETPGGGSLDTFLPLNFSFFWPELGV